MTAAEPLQVAQILADLMSLQNTDHKAATSLLRANKTLGTPSSQQMPRLKKSDSSMSSLSWRSESVALDDDEDMRRAKELVRLYAMRGKFKQMGDTGLGRAKERVDDVIERYAAKGRKERELAAKPRY